MTTTADEANQPVQEFEPGSLNSGPVTAVKAIDFGDASTIPGPPNLPPTGNWPTSYWRANPAGLDNRKGVQVIDTGWTTHRTEVLDDEES